MCKIIINTILTIIRFLEAVIFWLDSLPKFQHSGRTFYVYNPARNKPSYIHKSYISAVNEAQRLSENSTERFEVLEIICTVQNKLYNHEIPF